MKVDTNTLAELVRKSVEDELAHMGTRVAELEEGMAAELAAAQKRVAELERDLVAAEKADARRATSRSIVSQDNDPANYPAKATPRRDAHGRKVK